VRGTGGLRSVHGQPVFGFTSLIPNIMREVSSFLCMAHSLPSFPQQPLRPRFADSLSRPSPQVSLSLPLSLPGLQWDQAFEGQASGGRNHLAGYSASSGAELGGDCVPLPQGEFPGRPRDETPQEPTTTILIRGLRTTTTEQMVGPAMSARRLGVARSHLVLSDKAEL
jgi:hypothetical protein